MTLTATPILDSAECRRRLEADPTLRIVDVRTGGEYDSVHIPGSFNVPLDTLDNYARELARIDTPLLLVCQSGTRASQANAALAEAGTNQLMILDGGINAWQQAGGEVTVGATEKWALDRQVRLGAGLISLTGIAASILVPQAKWLAGGVAAGLTFSAVTNTCAMGNVLARLPYNQSNGQDVDQVVAALRTNEASR